MLAPRFTPGASVTALGPGWHLQTPPGPAGAYRLAQVDDYTRLPRARFPYTPATRLSLRARVSAAGLPGTWGFGFWNDPFALSSGLGGTARRLPSLPQAAWFFHASPENYLSLRNDKPAAGFLAATLSSPAVPSLLLAPGLLGAPLLFSPRLAQGLRNLGGRIVREDAGLLETDPTDWHAYRLDWHARAVEFYVDDRLLFETKTSPKGPLGLVIWIDNQYAAFTPAGKLAAGALENNATAWLELEDVSARSLAE